MDRRLSSSSSSLCVCVCLVCSPLCLQCQVGESCAYKNASRTPSDTRNSMEVHLARGAKRQETAQGAFDFDASRQGLNESRRAHTG